MAFTFLDDYRLDLSVRSLLGSRSRLQDVPKIAQLVEARLQAWFDERVVEPRFQQIVLPSLWPRKKNTRGGEGGDPADPDAAATAADLSPDAASSAGRRSRRGSRAVEEPAPAFGVQERPGSDSLEARMTAEGAKIREAEQRAQRGRAPTADGMRWRGPRDAMGEQDGDEGSGEWGSSGGMPGSMPI